MFALTDRTLPLKIVQGHTTVKFLELYMLLTRTIFKSYGLQI